MPITTRRAVLLGALAAPGIARAAFPERSIRLLVPYGGGGQTDIVSRVTAEALARWRCSNSKPSRHSGPQKRACGAISSPQWWHCPIAGKRARCAAARAVEMAASRAISS